MRTTNLCVVLLSTLSLCAAQSEAAIIVNGVTNSNAAPNVFNNFAPYQMALNFGGGNVTLNGVNFTGVTVGSSTPSPVVVATSPYTVQFSTTAGQTLNAANLGGNALYETEIYSSNNSPEQLLISGLDPATTYQFQFMHGDPRGLTYNNGTVSFTDSLANVVTQSLTFGPGGSGNEFALLRVTVSGSTSLLYSMPTAGRGPSFSGLTIQAANAPEPASVAMWSVLGVAGVAIAWRLRRKVDLGKAKSE